MNAKRRSFSTLLLGLVGLLCFVAGVAWIAIVLPPDAQPTSNFEYVWQDQPNYFPADLLIYGGIALIASGLITELGRRVGVRKSLLLGFWLIVVTVGIYLVSDLSVRIMMQ